MFVCPTAVVLLLGGKGVRVSTFCIIQIASSRRLQLYDVMNVTDRTAQWRACSSRSIASSRRLQLYNVMNATDRTAQWRACSSRSRLGRGEPRTKQTERMSEQRSA